MRGDKAKALFLQGYNCSQSVALAFADMLDMSESQIALMVSGYGGGMGRMREVCGTVSGAVFVISNLYGYNTPGNGEEKKQLYSIIQEFCKEFEKENNSIVCRELLQLGKNQPVSPVPEDRTEQYYKKRPCPELTKSSADILEKLIQKNNK